MSDNSYRHILKYTSIFGSVQGLSIAVGLVRNKAVALLLGPNGMGVCALFNSTIALMTEATNLGLPTSAVRSVSDAFENDSTAALERHIAAVRAWTVCAALLGFVACVLLGPLFSEVSFSYGNHTLNYIMLAPAVSLGIITASETAILKGTRCLRTLVWTQLAIMVSSLVIAIPIYWMIGNRGIMPVILLSALAQTAITLWFSMRKYPLHLHGFTTLLREGRPMLALGLAFVVTGITGKGAEVFMRYFLSNSEGGDTVVGLFNAGYMIAVTYAGMIFTALETDYYPRLSGCGGDLVHLNNMVNKQVEITTLLIAPMLLILMIAQPIVIPLLFSEKFVAIVPMSQVCLLAMYAKAVSLPAAYITLAMANWRAFVTLEALFSLFLCIAMPFCYNHWGLLGTGIAIAATQCFDAIIVWSYAAYRYRCHMLFNSIRHLVVQVGLAAVTYILIRNDVEMTWHVTASLLLIALSSGYSIVSLMHRTHKKDS